MPPSRRYEPGVLSINEAENNENNPRTFRYYHRYLNYVLIILTCAYLLATFIIHGFGFKAEDYLNPCNSSITIEDLNTLRSSINSTTRELESVSTVLNYHLVPPEKLLEKSKNLSDNRIQMEENWKLHKNEYYKCYKANLFRKLYHLPGYCTSAYYFLAAWSFLTIFILAKCDRNYDLSVDITSGTKVAFGIWFIFILASPVLIIVMYFPDDIHEWHRNAFPIYPH